MGTKVGEVREALMDAIEMVKSKKLSGEDALAVAKLAEQITRSLHVEALIRAQGNKGEKLPLGHMAIGHEPAAIENNAGGDEP